MIQEFEWGLSRCFCLKIPHEIALKLLAGIAVLSEGLTGLGGG